MLHSSRSCFRLLALAVSVAVIAPPAVASGFRIPEVSIYGMSSGNAVVADTHSQGALPYNPAVMSFHAGNHFVAGIRSIDPDIHVTTANGQFTSDVDTPFYVPDVFVMGELGSDMRVGISVNSPFGFEINWPDETFPAFAGPFDGLEPARSKLEMVNFNPNIAIALSPESSLALGFDYYWVKDVRLDTAGVKISGNGDGVGLNVAFAHRISNDWSMGLSWRSRVTVEIDATISGDLAASGTSVAETDLSFPAITQFGIRNQATSAFALEFDIEHTDWSSFNLLTVNHSLSPATGVPSPVTNTYAWKDSFAFRLGGNLTLSPTTELRFGYSTDKSPNADTHFSASVPDSDRQLFSVGIGQKVGGNWTVEAGYMYVRWDDRNYSSTVPFGFFGGDSNGTNAVNGTYEATAQLFGLGVNGTF